nr:33 kDa inner dynein arm light chain [Andalucia godoyi]|eukprot:ANDGO_08266.mRNA.1 Transcription factor IIIB 60 kDa subunit
MVRRCSRCGSSQVEHDACRGDTVCIQCGLVLEENTIVSEVTFAESASGATSVVGQFLPSSGSSFRTGSESREETIERGKRKIMHVASLLRLSQHLIEVAHRVFVLALQHGFMQGRRSEHVVAACLYAACRRERSPHMLLDFSEVLRENMYSLAHTFTKLVQLLNLDLPIVDPSLYIHRFAAELELGDKTHVVALTSLKLVGQMSRDWMQTGRRPTGIVAAALLLAARIHGFRRTQKDIVDVVRICEATLRFRLEEFGRLPIAQVSAKDFVEKDASEFHERSVNSLPPAYLKGMAAEESSNFSLRTPPGLDRSQNTGIPAEVPALTEKDDDEFAAALSQLERFHNPQGAMQPKPASSDIPSALASSPPSLDAATSGFAFSSDNLLSMTPQEEVEINSYLVLHDGELSIRKRMWDEMHGAFVSQQLEKRKERDAKKAEDDKSRKKKASEAALEKRRRTAGLYQEDPNRQTALQGVQEVVQAKKISNRINYNVFQSIFDEGGDVSSADSSRAPRAMAREETMEVRESSEEHLRREVKRTRMQNDHHMHVSFASEETAVSGSSAGVVTVPIQDFSLPGSRKKKVIVGQSSSASHSKANSARTCEQPDAGHLSEDASGRPVTSAREELGYDGYDDDDYEVGGGGGDDDWE